MDTWPGQALSCPPGPHCEVSVTTDGCGKGQEVTLGGFHSAPLITSEQQGILHVHVWAKDSLR